MDQAHLLPPDKFSLLTQSVFAQWNQPFKVVSAKKKLNGRYAVKIALKTGAQKDLEV